MMRILVAGASGAISTQPVPQLNGTRRPGDRHLAPVESLRGLMMKIVHIVSRWVGAVIAPTTVFPTRMPLVGGDFYGTRLKEWLPEPPGPEQLTALAAVAAHRSF